MDAYGYDVKCGWIGRTDEESKEEQLFATEDEYDEFLKDEEESKKNGD